MEPNWQEITKEAESFAKSRGIDTIDAIRCFEQCAKFISRRNKMVLKIQGTDLASQLKKKIKDYKISERDISTSL